MDKKYKIIKLTGSGTGTFSDRLTGNQKTNSDALLTNDNFIFSSPKVEYDSKVFENGEFSEPINREKLNEKKNVNIEVNNSEPKNNVLFSSLNDRVKNAVKRIVETYPGSLRSIPQDLDGESIFNLRNFSYDVTENTTSFSIDYRSIRNPLFVVYDKNRKSTEIDEQNNLKFFNVNFDRYQIVIDGNKFKITNAILPDVNSNDDLIVTVYGRVNYNQYIGIENKTIYITPLDSEYDSYFNGLSDFENFILNRETQPIFTSTFEILEEDTNGNLKINPVEVTWPRIDDYNIDVFTNSFNDYVEKINDLSNIVDGYKSNLLKRLLTASSIHEFDTEDQKIGKLLNIYGFTFDNLKSRIDDILYVRNVTYDGVNNITDDLLPEFEQFVGMAKVGGFNIEDLYDFLIKKNQSQFRGLNLQKTKKEKLLDFFRYLVINISYLYKSKGTTKTFKMLFSLMGLPDSFVEINEFTYRLINTIDQTKFSDFKNKITQGDYITKDVIYNEQTEKYEVIRVQNDVVNETLYPLFYKEGSSVLSPNVFNQDNSFYFQDGAGWYRLTDNHKSDVIIDQDRSNFEVTPKIIKTKFNDFAYGERYFNTFRYFYDTNNGWDLKTEIDNKQSKPNVENDIFNRKNIEIFNNPSNGVLFELLRWFKNNNKLYFGKDIININYDRFNNQTYKAGIDIGSGKYGKKYYDLENTYTDYYLSSNSPSHYEVTYGFSQFFSKNWMELFEKFVPSTTIWTGGDKVDNHNLHRQKFNWVDPHCIDVLDIDIPTKDMLKDYLVEFIDDYKNHPDCYGRQYVYANWYYYLKINDDILTDDGWKFLYTTYENDECDLLRLRGELISGGTHNVMDIDNKINLTCGFENKITCVGDGCLIADKITQRLSEYNKFAFKKYILPYLGVCDGNSLELIFDDEKIEFDVNYSDDINGCDLRELFRNLSKDEFLVTKDGIIELNNGNTVLSPLEYFEKYGYFDAFIIDGKFDVVDCVDCQQKIKLTPISYCGVCFNVNEFEFSLNIEVNEEYGDDLCDYKNYVYDDIPFSLEYVRLDENNLNSDDSFYRVFIKVKGGHRFDYKNDKLPYVVDFDVKHPKKLNENILYIESQDRFYIKLTKNAIRNIVIYDQAGSYIRVRLRYDDCGEGITMFTPELHFDIESTESNCDPFSATLMGLDCNDEQRNTNLDKFAYNELPNCQAFMSGSKVYRLIAPYRYPVYDWSDVRIKDEDCERDITVYTPEIKYNIGGTCDPIGATLMGTSCDMPKEKCESNIEMLTPYFTTIFKTGLLCDLRASYTIGSYVCRDENAFTVELVPVEEIEDGDFILTASYFEKELNYCDMADYYYGNYNDIGNVMFKLNMREVKGVGGVRIYKYVSINYDDLRIEHDHYVMIKRDNEIKQVTAENLKIGDKIFNFLDFNLYEVKHISNDDFCHKCYKDNFDYKYYLPINEDESVLTHQNGKNFFLLDWCENHCNPLECVCLDDPFYFCVDDVEDDITIL